MECEEKMVLIDKDRLKQLEDIESQIPRLIDEAIAEYKSNSLKRLHEKDKLNPKAVAERVKRYVEKNRDELNERRRKKRKLTTLSEHPESVEPKLHLPISQSPILNRVTIIRHEPICVSFD